jgi:hypothetical protein
VSRFKLVRIVSITDQVFDLAIRSPKHLKTHWLLPISTLPLPLPPLPLIRFMEMGSLSEKSDEQRSHLAVNSYQVDTGAELVSGVDSALDKVESLRIMYVGLLRSII